MKLYDELVARGLIAQVTNEEEISTLSQLLARNYDIALTDQDVELYMDRMERSLPRSREAGKMSVQELDDYLETLRRKKGAEEPGGSPGTTR